MLLSVKDESNKGEKSHYLHSEATTFKLPACCAGLPLAAKAALFSLRCRHKVSKAVPAVLVWHWYIGSGCFEVESLKTFRKKLFDQTETWGVKVETLSPLSQCHQQGTLLPPAGVIVLQHCWGRLYMSNYHWHKCRDPRVPCTTLQSNKMISVMFAEQGSRSGGDTKKCLSADLQEATNEW